MNRAAKLFSTLEALQRRLDEVKPAQGGVLAREDLNTAYDPLSFQIHHQLGIALDHLETFKRHCESDGLPMSAHYTLMRTALETTATALWLISPGNSDKRIIQALRLVWWSRKDADQLASELKIDVGDRTERLRLRLVHLKALRPANNQRRLEVAPIHTSTLLGEADKYLDSRLTELTLLSMWRLCSGMAHGNRAVAMMLLERRKIDPTDAAHLMTSSWAISLLPLTAAVHALSVAIDRFETHASRLN